MIEKPSPLDPRPASRDESQAWARDRRHLCLIGGGALLATTLSGCSVLGSKPPPPAPGAPAAGAPIAAPSSALLPPPTVLIGTVSAAANLNPSVSQRPSPLAIRLYELRAVADFAKADFMALYQGDVATLGSGLVLRDEFTLQPGESRPYQRTLSPETRFIAVFAAYRDVERASWRASAAVQPGRKQTLILRADSLALSLAIQP